MDAQRYIFPIKPRAFIAFHRDFGKYFHIPTECTRLDKVTGKEKDLGKPCEEFQETGFCPHTLSKQGRNFKDAIEKYNKYRLDLFHLAKHYKFKMVSTGMSFYYHYPVPAYWNRAKKDKHHGQVKLSKPDITNSTKALEDSLTGVDERVGQISGAGKFWFDPLKVDPQLRGGYVEILVGQPVYNPYNVDMQGLGAVIEMEDIETRRARSQARRQELKEQRKKELPKRNPKPLRIINQDKLFKREDKIK